MFTFLMIVLPATAITIVVAVLVSVIDIEESHEDY